jgi:hypothetical protein
MIPGLIAGGAVVAGGLLSYFGQKEANEVNRDIGRENNIFSAKQAALNRAFQERMSNTEWQRGVADMRAAGVNPMLAVSQGGASTPNGTSAQGIAQANQQNEMANFATSARDAMLLKSQIEQNEASTYASKAIGMNNDAQAALNMSRANLETLKIPEAQLASRVAESKWGMAAHLAERFGLNMNTALSLVSKFQRPTTTTSWFNNRTGEVSRTTKTRH